ncbi:MAG: zinc ribbon domain-containing protein [Armatimonadetes bacterium]|nr:zinc ribbon domain-containing protein [Armatimonadota bacterium]
MPIYEFDCRKCGARFEELCGIDGPDVACPICNSRDVERLISSFFSRSSSSSGSGSSSCTGCQRSSCAGCNG